MPAPLVGQVAVSGTAQPLSATPVTSPAYTIKAPIGNNTSVFLGPAGVTATTGHALDPGETLDYQKSAQSGQAPFQLNLSDFYVVGTAPDKVTWFASP